MGRNRSSPFFPPAVPDLRGLRERRYFDKSGLNQHRGIPDLMRYAAMAEGIEFFSSFDGFIPFGGDKFDKLPNPDSLERFSERCERSTGSGNYPNIWEIYDVGPTTW